MRISVIFGVRLSHFETMVAALGPSYVEPKIWDNRALHSRTLGLRRFCRLQTAMDKLDKSPVTFDYNTVQHRVSKQHKRPATVSIRLKVGRSHCQAEASWSSLSHQGLLWWQGRLVQNPRGRRQTARFCHCQPLRWHCARRLSNVQACSVITDHVIRGWHWRNSTSCT